MERQKTQAVFLVDTCSPPAENLSRYCRSLCLVCTRILLFLSQFPNKEHQGRVQWNYKFFNSRKPEISVRTQTAQFYENRSELLQKFFGQLQSSLEHTHNQSSSLSLSWPQPPVKLVYSALAAAVQDFTWDAPEITSPIRRPSALSKRAKRGRKSDVKDNRTTKNVIFICSMCPQSKDELCHFLYGSQKQSDDSMVMLRSELLPPALLLQLEERGITVHWVDTQCACGKNDGGLSQMSNILKTAGGTLIPISTLVNPTCSQLIQQAVGDISPPPEGRKCEHQSEDVTSLPTSSRTLAQVERVVEAGDDRMDVVPPEVCVDHASVQQSNEDKSVGSSSQSAPSKKNTQHSKSSFLLQELLSSLIFPPSTHLRECLQPHAGSSSLKQALPTPLTLQDNFFWLCTNAGKILCILDLSPMHTFPATKPSKGNDTISLHCPPPTHSAREEEKQSNTSKSAGHKLKKEHSFSRMVPGSSVSNAGEESTATSDRQQSDDRPTSASDETHCTSGGSRKDADEPSLNDVSSVPYMETLGLIKQSDLPLTWLSSATVYSCVGLYVPREFRCKHLSLRSSNRITAARAPDGGCGVDTSSKDKGEQPLTDYRESVLTDVCPMTPKALPTDNLSLSTSPSHQQAVHVPPQIHLCRCPVTPPNDTKIKSPKGKSLFCPELRRSPRLNAPKFKKKENTGEIALHHEPSDGEHQVKCYTPPRMFSHLASISPKYPVVQLRDILSNRTCTQPLTTNHQLRSDDSYVVSFPLSLIPRAPTGDKVPCSTPSPHEHLPSESLALSGRFHSRQYQNLCLWLARNGLLLLLNVSPQSPAPEVCSHLAVLQPITSLVATLSLIKPRYHAKLVGKLTNPPSFNHPSATTSTSKSKNRRHKGVQSTDVREDKLTGTKATERVSTPDFTASASCGRNTGKVHEKAKLHGEPIGGEGVGDDFSCTKTNSDLQSHAVPVTVPRDASHLEGNHANRRKEEFTTCYATDPELYVSLRLLFTHNHTDGHHSRSSCTSSLQPALLHSLMEGSPFTHLPLLPWFPYLHSCGVTQQTILELQQMHQELSEDGFLRRVQLDTALKALYTSSEGLFHTAEGDGEEGDREEGGAGSDAMDTAEPSAHAQVKGEGQVSQNTGEHSDGIGMAARPESVTEFFEWFDPGYQEQVGLSSDDDSLQTWAHKAMARLHADFMLVAPEEDEEPIGQRLWRELNTKVLLSSGQLQEKYETLSCEEGEGKERRISEYQLQVFLHFEAMRVCNDISFDTSAMADQLVRLLRRISLLANPAIMGHCVKEVILPSYIGCCRVVLTEVYEGLMLPLPPELYCSPATNPTLDSSDSDETPLRSLQEPPAPKMVTANAKSLVRHTSFQAQKQIAVKKQKKTRHLKNVDSKVPIRFSPRLAMLSERNTSQSGKGVCRSLFSRSQSVSFEMGSKQKKEGDDAGKQASKRKRALQRYRTHSDIIVKETPIKKQVDNYRRFKLQRLRSKSQVGPSPGVMTIEESPRRSFYSAPKAGLSKPHFKTPPPPLRNKHLSPKVILKKEPSPAALHSLLHGEIISPTQAEPNGSGAAFLPENPIVDESPDLFEAREITFVPGLSTSRATRMLTYDTEDPLRVQRKYTLSEPDLVIENESASMMAFALCTPTKEDPVDFCDAFL